MSTLRAVGPGFDYRLCFGDISGLSHTGDFKVNTPVATLPGAWYYRVSAGTGWPGVSILWLGEMESLVCNFCLSVAAHKIVQIRPWDTLACCWDIKQPTNKQTNPWVCRQGCQLPLACCHHLTLHIGVCLRSSGSRVQLLPVLWGYFWVESYWWLWSQHSSGYPAGRLVL